MRLAPLPDAARIDPAPSDHWPEPHLVLDPDAFRGGVLVTVEWRVPPENVDEFAAAREAALHLTTEPVRVSHLFTV